MDRFANQSHPRSSSSYFCSSMKLRASAVRVPRSAHTRSLQCGIDPIEEGHFIAGDFRDDQIKPFGVVIIKVAGSDAVQTCECAWLKDFVQ
ncbi:hypothetical protein [Sphingosinicella sp. CPCC 101087]|uniref:hypothetical protein n=1 Tax=Sphingosinicella sp. CPCC 101087 TaxID=2497754 RepID=UPI0013EA504E|nr:hypothetical protein [Sphingosinicella sp. CPCC 101087]